MSTLPNPQKVLEDALSLPSDFKSVQLATASTAGIPEASYACYLFKEGKYYLYLSRLATHFHNLAQNPRCSLLFIENEADAKQIFARRRLSIQCLSQIIQRDSEKFQSIMTDFSDKFGHFMRAIRDLVDFDLFELSPQYGSYVAGFAQAYQLSGEDLSKIIHRREITHQKA